MARTQDTTIWAMVNTRAILVYLINSSAFAQVVGAKLEKRRNLKMLGKGVMYKPRITASLSDHKYGKLCVTPR